MSIHSVCRLTLLPISSSRGEISVARLRRGLVRHVQLIPRSWYCRPFATHTSKPDGNEILAAQRLHRPVAPHLSIYRPQITWYASALNRITGALLSGAFYSYFAVYLVGPVLGWHVGSMTLAASFGALPVLAKVAVKFGLALPFAFHSLNGIRHLVWDFGLQMKNKQVAFTGWLVIGLSVVGSMVLALV